MVELEELLGAATSGIDHDIVNGHAVASDLNASHAPLVESGDIEMD